MIPGSMSHEPSRDSVPQGTPPEREPNTTSARLARELQEVRERALGTFEEIAEGRELGRHGATSSEGSGPLPDTIEDDDLGVKEKIEQCSSLRASLVRHWAETHASPSAADVQALIEVNEAIDRSLMASITRAREHARHTREMFLAVLGHDLRTPLGA